MKTVVLLASVAGCAAHMGITLNGDNNFPREKASVGDNYRSPDLTATCHASTPGTNRATIVAGVNQIGKMTYGAAHGGGHCTWMISEDEKTWYKINDKVDCTTIGTHDLVVPANVPASCETTGCTLGWFWTPRLSGGCEIYHNCFDVKVTGATGGIESAATTIKYTPGATPTCTRVNTAGQTPIYGTFIGPGGQQGGGAANPTAAATPTQAGNAPAPTMSGLVNGCLNYTVVPGDTLTKIAAMFDIEWALLVDVNPSLDANPDLIFPGQKFQVPQTGAAVAAKSCEAPAPTAAGTPTSAGDSTDASSASFISARMLAPAALVAVAVLLA